MDNRLTPGQKDELIEQALREAPLAQMPHDITVGVMARIQRTPTPRPFSITWSDLVLGLVIALSVGALYFTLQNMPPIALMKLRIQGILLYQAFIVNARWLVPTVLFGSAAVLSALTIPYLRKEL